MMKSIARNASHAAMTTFKALTPSAFEVDVAAKTMKETISKTMPMRSTKIIAPSES